MIKFISAFCALSLCCSCNKEKLFDGPDFYEDDFERYTQTNDMFLPYPDLDKYFSFTQITKEGNSIVLDTAFSHSGNQSVRCFGLKSDGTSVSKASINKQHMAFWENETIRITAWYYIQGNEDADWLFIMDLEENTNIGAGPGMRLALVDNHLAVEHKFNESDIFQPAGAEVDFPRNQWVQVMWEIKLSRKKKGTVKLWQDGQLLIDATGTKTLPKDFLYFQQGTKGMYSNIEFGVTANSNNSQMVLWVDDVRIEKLN